MERLMATASVTGAVLGTASAKMQQELRKGGRSSFTPGMAVQDQAFTTP
jgi:hypothetical protein